MGVLGVLGDGSPAKNTNVNCITRYALHGLALVLGSGLWFCVSVHPPLCIQYICVHMFPPPHSFQTASLFAVS